MKIWKGHPYPLGATWMGTETNFALLVPNAARVELCFYDEPHDVREIGRVEIEERTNEVWHVFLPEIRPRTLYGYRVHGPWEPAKGLRFEAWNFCCLGHRRSAGDWSSIRHWTPVSPQRRD